MELRQLSYVVAVAHAGSFSKAAAELMMTQPALSTAIAGLESELGAALFERSSRGVTLTPTGAYLVRQSQRLLRDVAEMRDIVRSMAGGNAGSLSIGMVPPLAWQLGPRLLRAFTQARPEVDLNIREENAEQVIELLIEGAIDAGMVVTSSSSHLREFHHGSLVVHNLGTVELIAALPTRFADTADPIRLVDIAREEIALPPPSARTSGLRAGLVQAFDRAGLTPPRMRDVPSMFEAIPLVMADLAVGILPEAMRVSISSPDLVFRSIVDGPAPLDISLLHRPGIAATPTVRAFTKLAVQFTRPAPSPHETLADG